MTQQDTLTKKYVRICFRGEALKVIRLYHKIASFNFDLVHGPRHVTREAEPRGICCITRRDAACIFFGIFDISSRSSCWVLHF